MIAVTSIVGQEAVVRKTQFPRLVIPLAVVLTTFFNLGAEPRRRVRLHPGLRRRRRRGRGCCSRSILLLLFVITTAVSMIVVDALPALPRHGDHLGRVASTVLFYATPVLYPIEVVPQRLHDLILLNPLAPLFELARSG